MTGIYMGAPNLRHMSEDAFERTIQNLRVFLDDGDIAAIRCLFRDDPQSDELQVFSLPKGKRS